MVLASASGTAPAIKHVGEFTPSWTGTAWLEGVLLGNKISTHATSRKMSDRVLMSAPEALLPFIYTPTVGEACQRYHTLPGLRPYGLQLSLDADRGRIADRLRAWPQQQACACCGHDDVLLGLMPSALVPFALWILLC
jgi:hypothetical protein